MISNQFLKSMRLLCLTISVTASVIIFWFDCTHELWVWSECICWRKVLDKSFAFSNIDHWFWFAVPILLANLGVYFRLKCFGRWYDYVYLFRCLFGIFMSVVVLTLEIPWNGVVHTCENEHPYEDLYLYSLLLTIFLLLPSDLILFSLALYKKLRKKNN